MAAPELLKAKDGEEEAGNSVGQPYFGPRAPFVGREGRELFMTQSLSEDDIKTFEAARRSFGKRIAALREQQGRSRQELAGSSGISIETIQQSRMAKRTSQFPS